MHPPPSPARTNFTLITECTPESSGCNSVYSVVPQCMSPRRNCNSPKPSLASECAPFPRTGGWGHTRLRVRSWKSPNSDDLRKNLALCLLCDLYICTIAAQRGRGGERERWEGAGLDGTKGLRINQQLMKRLFRPAQ